MGGVMLMEPAINPDLTHSLIAPFDTTLAEMHDMGWFTDADLDGQEDATVLLNGCDTRVPNAFIGNGALLADQARVWFNQCSVTTSSPNALEDCVDSLAKAAYAAGIITDQQSSHVRQCVHVKGKSGAAYSSKDFGPRFGGTGDVTDSAIVPGSSNP